MFLPELKPAFLQRRYQRFLADVITPEGQPLTLHCANTGAMLGCAEQGDRVWYWNSKSTTRKYPLSWELTETSQKHLVCVNTHRANQIMLEALVHKRIPEFTSYPDIFTEVKYGDENSRIDFLLKGQGLPDCYIEVKSTTFVQETTGLFPDAVTLRGQKHLRELMHMKRLGHRAVIFFAGLHDGFNQFQVADFIDPNYAYLLRQAVLAGVEVYCYAGKFQLNKGIPTELGLTYRVPILGL